MPRIDLHMHSTASDGAYAPAEVVQIALEKNMEAIALTDHDSLNGIAAARAAAQRLTVFSGVELSAEDAQADRHILGYGFRLDANTALYQACIEYREARVSRIAGMIAKLDAMGLHVSLEDVLASAKGGAVGRPHLARVMLRQGMVANMQEAFDKYISDDGPAYVPHHPLAPERAIQMIHEAGGVAVLAHPGRYDDYHAILDMLCPIGLDGVEVYYPDHTPEISADLARYARQHKLLMTVGSDFHRREGDGSARIGTVYYPPDLDILGPLRERISA